VSNYAFEGPTWAAATVTWSFASTNLAQDTADGYSFSSFMTQTQYQAVVEMALQRWSAVTGIAFVEVADSAATDIRIGWGNLSTSGSSEIGNTSFFYNPDTNYMDPDILVRLEDPVDDPLSGTSAANYTYAQTVTQLYQVVLHELGHALGMDHSTDKSAVMYPTGLTTNRDLDPSDIAGIQTLYGPAFVATAGIAGPGGTQVVVGFDVGANAATAQTLLNGVASRVASIDFIAAAGTYSEPAGDIAVVDDAVGAVTLATNTAANQSIVAGAGGLVLAAFGSGTVVAGGGANQVFVTAAKAGPWDILLGNGANTVLAATGNETIAAGSGKNLEFLGAGASSVVSAGADTIIGGTGHDNVSVSGAGALVFGGTGGVAFTASAGVSTVVGLGGALSVAGGAGGGVFFGGTSGGNTIAAGSAPVTIVGGGAGDVLSAAGSASDVIAGGAGAETISGIGSTGANTFFAGSGPERILSGAGNTAVAVGAGNDTLVSGSGYSLYVFANGHAGGADVISGFDPVLDHLTLLGYAAGAAANAVANATVSGGSTLLGLSDGTTISFAGFTGLTTQSFV
jgi:Ca2+-binding RTX toxin-like protein